MRALTAGGEKAAENDGAKPGNLARYIERLPEKFRHLAAEPNVTFELPAGGRALGVSADDGAERVSGMFAMRLNR